MLRSLWVVVLLLVISLPAMAEQEGFKDTLLDQLAGSWLMQGTIAGNESVHDIQVDWVLGHHYLQFYELSRETEEDGTPLYEAIVTFGWDETHDRYVCLWLDSTGGSGLSSKVLGYAEPNGDDLLFEFDMGEGGIIHTHFLYNRESDDWRWTIDIENNGEEQSFAKLMLTRK